MYQQHMLLQLRKPILKYALNKYHSIGFQCVPTTYVTAIKETYFEICTKQVVIPLVFNVYQQHMLRRPILKYARNKYHSIGFPISICLLVLK